MKKIKISLKDFNDAEKYTFGNINNISDIREKVCKYSYIESSIYILHLKSNKFNLIFTQKNNDLILKTCVFRNKITEMIVPISEDNEKIDNFLYNTHDFQEEIEYFKSINKVEYGDSILYIGLGEDSLYASAKYTHEDNISGNLVFLTKIPYTDISNVEYIDSSILFKEKSSGLYMILDSLSKIDLLLIYAKLKEVSKEIF